MFVFVDTETTGLDPMRDYVLELGIVVTDDDFRLLERQHDGDDRTSRFSALIRPALPLDQIVGMMDDVVLDMHRASGLLAKLEAGGVEAGAVEESALEFLSVFDALGQPMAGSNIPFDRAFLAEDMPQLERAFGYRNIDVSTVKELARRWSPEVLWTPPPVKAHRALDDIAASINELSAYRKWMTNGR